MVFRNHVVYLLRETTSYLRPPCEVDFLDRFHGPLTRYVKLRVAHAPGMPGTFSPPTLVSDPDMHHGTCVTHVPWCMPGSLISGFLWSRWRGNCDRIPGACATRNFTYLVRGPLCSDIWVSVSMMPHSSPDYSNEKNITNCSRKQSLFFRFTFAEQQTWIGKNGDCLTTTVAGNGHE